VLLFGVLARTQAAAAADARVGAPDPWSNPIAADRPGAANPTSVVGAGVVQLETALESIRQGAWGEPRDGLLDFPTTLRVGVSGALEARLESPLLSRLSPGGRDAPVSGFSDVSLEVKWRVRRAGRGAAPALALLPALGIPTGSDAFTAHDYQLGLTGLGDWTLGESGSLGLNLVLSGPVGAAGADAPWELNGASSVGVSIGRRWALGGDVFSAAPPSPGQDRTWGLDEGLALLLSPDVQADASVAESWSGSQRSLGLQLGLSARRSAWTPVAAGRP
jgi:hypothetical protein